MSESGKPKRRRALDTQANGKVPASMKNLAKEFYFANCEANAAAARASKARKELFASMKDAGIEAFDVKAMSGGVTITLAAVIAPGRAMTTVDVDKLRKLVDDDEKLLEMGVLSCTKTAVVTHCGTAMADQVCKSTPGSESVTVKPRN